MEDMDNLLKANDEGKILMRHLNVMNEHKWFIRS